MKRTILSLCMVALLASCDVAVNQNDGDPSDTSKLDKVLDKVDTTIDKGLDTVRAKIHDLTRDRKKDTVVVKDSAR